MDTNTILKERFCREFFKFILDNPNELWDWFHLSLNPSITWKIIQDNPDKPWDWSGLSQNKMGYPHTKKIKKTKEVIYWKTLQKHNNLLGYDKRLNRYDFYLFMQHLI